MPLPIEIRQQLRVTNHRPDLIDRFNELLRNPDMQRGDRRNWMNLITDKKGHGIYRPYNIYYLDHKQQILSSFPYEHYPELISGVDIGLLGFWSKNQNLFYGKQCNLDNIEQNIGLYEKIKQNEVADGFRYWQHGLVYGCSYQEEPMGLKMQYFQILCFESQEIVDYNEVTSLMPDGRPYSEHWREQIEKYYKARGQN